MFSKVHFLKGMLKNLFNPHISFLSFVSANNIIDNRAVIYRMVKIKNSSVGRYSYVAHDTDVECADIGQFCSIADNCRIGMAGHSLNNLSTSPLFTIKNNACKAKWIVNDIQTDIGNRVVLGNDVWVGSHVLINGGVTVGNGAVIGAGAVVVKDVPPYAIVGGVPAKIIRYRFSPEVIDKLMELNWWNMEDDMLKENISFFQKEHITVEDIDCFISSVR